MHVSPDELAARVSSLVDGADASVAFTQLTVDVPAEQWQPAGLAVRDDEQVACRFFDWLSAYDASTTEQPDTLAVVAHVWSTAHRHHLRLRTTVPSRDGHVPTLTNVWPGAEFMEREAFEMMGINFLGHPDLRRILLPDDFVGYPMRRDFETDFEYITVKQLVRDTD